MKNLSILIYFLLNSFMSYGDNPWDISKLYINPILSSNIDSTLSHLENDLDSNIIQNMKNIKNVPSAYWIDIKEKITIKNEFNETYYIEGIMNDALKTKSIVNFIVYNLPNRDCKAMASNGQICCNRSDKCKDYCSTSCQFSATECDDGLNEYISEYIDPLFELLSKDEYSSIVKILIIEPDSLPNCVTNLGMNGCSELTCDIYKKGITYTLNKFSKIPNVVMYLDAGHGGWLGWENNITKYLSLISELPYQFIRGFATNVANYQPIGSPCPMTERFYDFIQYCKTTEDDCCLDPCEFFDQYNIGNHEVNYAQLIYSFSKNLNLTSFNTDDGLPRIIIDTGRNGNPLTRTGAQQCKVWCNVNNAKIGTFPTIDTPLSNIIDAFVWLKTPGESDGCIDYNIQKRCKNPSKCVRYDSECGNYPQNFGYSKEQTCPPEAGHWFEDQFIQLNDY